MDTHTYIHTAESTGEPSADTNSLVQTQAGMSKLEIREREAMDLEELERYGLCVYGCIEGCDGYSIIVIPVRCFGSMLEL